MNPMKSRAIVRWIHLAMLAPTAGYVFARPQDAVNYEFPMRFVFFPILVVTGLWMWQGHRLMRLLGRRA